MSFNKVNYIDGQTIISAKNMNDIQDELMRLREKEAVQSDWSQNDETALDFIKNRTHWSNHQEGEFFNGLFEDNDGTWMFMAMDATLPILNCDEKYQVIIENQIFESNLKLLEEIGEPGLVAAYLFGDHSLMFPDLDSTGEPFILMLAEGMDNGINAVVGMLMFLDDIPRETDGYRIKISGQFNSVKKLDEIYMPQSYNVAKNVLSNLIYQMGEAQTDISSNKDLISNIQLTLQDLLYLSPQKLTEVQKAQVRKNIGAVGIDEQVQVDLSETDESSFAFVKGTLRREHLPVSIPRLASYHGGIDPVSVLINDWTGEEGIFMTELTIENSNLLQQICKKGIGFTFSNDSFYTPLYHITGVDMFGQTYTNASSTVSAIFIDDYTRGVIMVTSNEKPTFTKVKFANLSFAYGTEGARVLHPALLPDVAVKRYELDDLNLITLEDIDFICAKRVKVTFPVHGLSVRISYTDAKGVFHENEDLPEKYKTTYEVLKGTSIILNGNYFDETSFVLPEDNKYYTKISDSEIIPLMDFEIKYADSAPA